MIKKSALALLASTALALPASAATAPITTLIQNGVGLCFSTGSTSALNALSVCPAGTTLGGVKKGQNAQIANDGTLTIPGVYRGAWAASTNYLAGDMVLSGSTLYSANATFTTGSSFNSANWTAVISAGSGGGVSIGTTSGTAADAGAVSTALATKAPIDSPTFTTTANAPTPATSDNSTKIATTAAVRAMIAAYGAGNPFRVATGTTDAVSIADANGKVSLQNASAITETPPCLANGTAIAIEQGAAGQVTIAAGTGVTLASDKATASYVSARPGAQIGLSWVTAVGGASCTVYVTGNTQ